MFKFEAVSNAFDSERYKEKVRKGIDDFGGVDGRIIVLETKHELELMSN